MNIGSCSTTAWSSPGGATTARFSRNKATTELAEERPVLAESARDCAKAEAQ